MAFAAVEAANLSVRLGRRTVVESQSWVHSSGILGLLGPNGAGKTSLLSVLGTLRRPSSGTARVGGHDLQTRHGIAQARAATGYLPQSGFFVPSFTVRESVAYALWLKGQRNNVLVEEALERSNTAHLATRKMSRLSGGERQRVGIAQAVVSQPGVLLLDEPTASLDPIERRSVLDVLASLSGTTTIIMSTHNVADLPGICDSVMAVSRGKVRFHGSVRAFAAVNAPTATDLEIAYARCVEVPA